MDAPHTAPMVGGCLCGRVRFAARGPSLFSCHCHCHWCRRAHGAAFVTWLGMREDAVELTQGGDAVRWYSATPQSRRGFCDTCGTTLFFASTLAPGELHIAQALLDAPADRAPQAHVFFDAHVPWVALSDALPRLRSGEGGLAKWRAIPDRPDN